MSYLLSKRAGVYYFRRVVPVDVRGVIGKSEFMFSLGTKDPAEAKRLRTAKIIETDAQIDAARRALGGVAEPSATQVPPADPNRPRSRAEVLQDWDREQAEFSEGPGALEPEEFQEWLADQNNKGKGIYLDAEILDGWAAERKPSAKGRAAYESSAKQFYTIMGKKSAELITKADVMAYKGKLIADPNRSQTNVRDHLGYLRTLLNWAAQEDLISFNPANDVRIRVTEKGDKRPDFNIDDLNALFSGPVHAKGERPKAGCGEAAYWLPLLALFMGARREELGQLRVSDVRKAPYMDEAEQRQEAWCINITDTPDDGLANQIKNAASERLIPLHPKLIELGFVEYVQSLADQRGRVFPALKPVGIGQKLTDKWGQWFSAYKKECGITDSGKVFHSFRHTWKTHAVEAELSERVCRAFQGHEGKDAADKYGQAPSMFVMVRAIATYQVRGLQLTA